MPQKPSSRTGPPPIMPPKGATPPLQANDECFSLLTDSIRDYAIITLDPEGRVVYWNAGAERLLDYEAQEIVGHHFSCFFAPDDIQAGLPQRELQRARTEGRSENDHWYVQQCR